MNQLSIGFQAGAEGFSEIIFFQNKRSFDEFTSGNFELGANVVAVEITAAAEGATPRPGTRTGARSAREAVPLRGLTLSPRQSGRPVASTAFNWCASGASSMPGIQRPKQARFFRQGSVRVCRNCTIGPIADCGTRSGSTT